MNELLKSSGNAGTPIVKYEITEKDLRKVIENVIKDTANLVLSKFEDDRNTEFITRKEAMEFLNVKSPVTMMNWEEKDYLNPHRIGGRIFYRKDEVIQAFEKFSRVETL